MKNRTIAVGAIVNKFTELDRNLDELMDKIVDVNLYPCTYIYPEYIC